MGLFNLDETKRKKELKSLECSYEMMENTIKETEIEMRNKLDSNGDRKYTEEEIQDKINLLKESEKEIIGKYEMLEGNVDDLVNKKSKKTTKLSKSDVFDLVSKIDLNKDYQSITEMSENLVVDDVVNPDNTKKQEKYVDKVLDNKQEIVRDNEVTEDADYIPDVKTINFGESFDVIPIPSKGECYKNKIAKIPVAYLTASDENMIVSPNLYRDNLILDYLLKAKIKNEDINPMDLLDGDREAILLFLRASGYGNEYPVKATDGKSGESFETVIDLSKIKFKEFNLKADENGWFEYVLPVTKHVVKFKFLTHREKLKIKKYNEIEEENLAKTRIKGFVDDLDLYIEHDDSTDKQQKIKIKQAIREIDKWQAGLSEDKAVYYTHALTTNLEMSIMSVDGVTDRNDISNFIKNMNVRDSASLRKYILDNEPGLDYNVEIEKPESLGGGSMNVFLQLDQYVFLNIAN